MQPMAMEPMATPPPVGPTSAPVDTPGGQGNPAQRLFGLVREIRAECQNIGRSLDAITTALALTAPAARAAEVATGVAGLNVVLTENVDSVNGRFAGLRSLLDSYSSLYDAAGDETTALENLWRRLTAALAWPDPSDEAAIRAGLDTARGLINEIEWHAALITIPPRAKRHMAALRVGNKLPFDATFSDELSDVNQRTKMLIYLREHPTFIDGVVDVAGRVIIRASPNLARRMVSYIGLPAFAILGGLLYVNVLTGGIPFTDVTFAGVTGIRPERFDDLLQAYVLVIFGQLAHIVIEAVKQQQRGDDGFLALDDWLMWIHVRETSIAVGIVVVWLSLYGLAQAFPTSIPGVTAFTAGYSIDSLLGLFITRFETTMATTTKGLLAKLGSAAA